MIDHGDKNFIFACLLIITGAALAGIFYFARPVLLPFVVALLLSYAVAPVQDYLQTTLRLPRYLAVICTVLFGFGVLLLFGLLVAASFKGLAENVTWYQQKLAQLAADWTAPFEKYVGTIDSRDIRERLMQLPIAGIVQSTLGNVAAIVSNIGLIVIFIVYLLAGRQAGTKESRVLDEVDRKVKKYVSLKIVISAVTGLLVGLILWLIGLKFAVTFGLLAFLLNLIPTIGSIIATLLPIPIALAQFGSPVPVVLVIVLPGALQFSVGNVVEPLLFGKDLDLHPITVLLALVFWGMVWGLLGMFVAVPITAVMQIACDHIEQTRPIARLMAGNTGASNS